jgi:hypothetical protein
LERNFHEDAPQYATPSATPNGSGRIASLPPTATTPPGAPSTGGDQPGPEASKKQASPKATYTPPPAGAPPPAQPAPGLQGHLVPQTIQAPVNPAITTAGAIQTYNLAKGLLAGQE